MYPESHAEAENTSPAPLLGRSKCTACCLAHVTTLFPDEHGVRLQPRNDWVDYATTLSYALSDGAELSSHVPLREVCSWLVIQRTLQGCLLIFDEWDRKELGDSLACQAPAAHAWPCAAVCSDAAQCCATCSFLPEDQGRVMRSDAGENMAADLHAASG